MFPATMGMRLRAAYLTFHRRANAHFEQFGATADQFVILSLLAEEDGLTPRELVERASSDPNTIGEMLRRLEQKKLIRRRPHPSDGRARCVDLTAHGRKTQRRLQQSWQVPLGEIEASFLRKELELLVRLLDRIPGAVDRRLLAQQDDVA